MPALDFHFRDGGIYLPRLRLWLDPHLPRDELVFVSHAHSDHTADHREVILSAPTARLMAARLGGQRIEHALAFHEPRTFRRGDDEFRITLFPAGHIFGSAMSLIEAGGESLLFTGDFKLRRGLSAEACQPVHANVLIMETTYGRPQYRFPSTEDVMRGVVRFCREALDNDETAVLYGYSLGKSQEILCALGEAGLPIVLHGTVFNMTRIYEQFGHCFPPYEKYEAGKAQGKVVLCPPSVSGSAMLRNLGKTRCAVLTGWAVDPGCKYRYRCEAAFPLSDHADYPDLIDFVKQVQPGRVHTLHGFAGDFAATLRGLGYQAAALSEDEQMVLGLDVATIPTRTGKTRSSSIFKTQSGVGGAEVSAVPLAGLESSQSPSRDHASPFADFAATCAAIGATPAKLEKARLLAVYLQSIEREAVPAATIWFTGLPFAPSENRVLQVGWALLRDALCAVTGTAEQDFHQAYLKHSDLGETAAELWTEISQVNRDDGFVPPVPGLSLRQVRTLFEALQVARGPTAKLPLLVEGFARCSRLEVKYLVKIITSDLRIGLKEGLVEEALARAFQVQASDVRNAHLLLGHIGETARLAAANRLSDASIEPFRPVKFMLASPEETAAGIWERLAGRGHASSKSDGLLAREGEAAALPIESAATHEPADNEPSRLAACGSQDGAQNLRARLSTQAAAARDQSQSGTQVPGHSPPPKLDVEALHDAPGAQPARAVWLEDKYDGVRCQLHKVGGRVALYSRDLRDITTTFHDVAESARTLPADAILDGEILAMRGEEVLPFAELQKRLGRREHDLFLREEVPIQFVAFDLLWCDGASLLNASLRERRAGLEKILAASPLRLARITEAGSVDDIENTFAAARGRNNEGIMAKDPGSRYSPGRRGLAWLKLKKALATLDCVVVGAEYGHGKRSQVLSDYTFAVRDDTTGELKTIGKAYSGLTDGEIATLTQHFLARTVEKHGRYHVVVPDTVLEIAFDRIQESERHNSGLSMRFPRIVRIRADKSVNEIDGLAAARRLVRPATPPLPKPDRR